MGKFSAGDLRKRKKEALFVYGYPINNASEITPGIDVTQNKIHIYGEDDPVLDNIVENGTLNIAVQDNTSDRILQSLLTLQDPGATGNKAFNYTNINPVNAWVNIKNDANTQYVGSLLFTGWTPTPGMPTGGADEKTTRTYSGQCGIPKEYNIPITGKKTGTLTLTGGNYEGTFTYTGAAAADIPDVPGATSGTKAIQCFGIAGDTIEEVTVTAATLSFATPNWKVSVPDANITITPTSLYVVCLFIASKGIYPTAGLPTPDKLKT